MHPVLRKFSKRRPRTYGLILLALGAALAKFGQWGAASSIPILIPFIPILWVAMVLGIVFGISGIVLLVLGSKYNPDWPSPKEDEPSPKEIKPRAHPGAYTLHMDGAVTGRFTITPEKYSGVFRTGPEHFYSTYGLFHLPDFVVYDTAGRELLRIRRERRLPSQFVVLEDGRPVSTIRQRSIFLNKYTMDFADGSRWMFHMPLYTVFFGGVSGSGASVRVLLETHNVWYVLIDSGVDTLHLVSSLAFIHRERLRCV